jgi:streptogramin lyase
MCAISKFSVALMFCSTVVWGWPQLSLTRYSPPGLFRPSAIATGPDGALWFTDPFTIGEITTGGITTLYPSTDASSGSASIVTGPDGALWFTQASNNIGRITTAGVITQYAIPTANSNPRQITVGPDGALWFTEQASNKIGRITISGAFTEYPLPTPSGGPLGIAAGPDGALWFTEGTGNKIGRITTSGAVTEYAATASNYPVYITAGPDGTLWFTEGTSMIGRITTAGAVTEYPLPNSNDTYVGAITVGSDGALWFGEFGKIGRISTDGIVSEYYAGSSFIVGITSGPDGALWFTNFEGPPSIWRGVIVPVVGPSIYQNPAPGGDVGLAYHFAVRVADGAPPYSNWSVSSGSLPPGLALDAATGIISGTPTAVTAQPFGASFGVKVQDSAGNTSFEQYFFIAITPALQITGPTFLPNGIEGVTYPPVFGNVFFTSTGGSIQHPTWSASGLPSGLILSSTGTLYGAPSAGTQGNYNPTFTATDTVGGTASVTLPIRITATEPVPLQITTNLEPLNINGFYNQILTATGGYPPYFWSVSAGSLPPGISLQSNYNLYGTVTASGTYNFTLQAKDYANFTTTKSYTLTVGNVVITGTLPAATVGKPYSQNLTATGGSPPYSWTMFNNAGGLTLSSSGTLSGTPTIAGTFSFTAQVTDANSWTAVRSYSLTVLASGPPVITTTTLSPMMVGLSYAQGLSATGGTPPYSWSVASGSLPAGLELAGLGIIQGTPTIAGTQTFTLRLTDAMSLSTTQTLSLTVNPANCSYTLSPGGQVFPSAGGSGSITVTAGVGCPWALSGAPAWVTIASATSGTGNGSVNYVISANNGSSALNATLTIAGLFFTIQEQGLSVLNFIGSMPHLAAEENWTTAFTLVNKSAASATARLSFFGDPAGMLSLPLTFPQQPPASNPLLAASLDETISANASLTIQTAGPHTPPVQIGSAQLAAAGAMDGFAIFHQIPTAQEAVVPMETRNAPSYLLAFDNTGGVVLGVAVENVSTQDANIGVVLRDDTGALLGTGTLTLPGSGHISFVLSTQFPVATDQRGTIEFDTPPGGQISVLGIRFSPPNNALTTIPALANVGVGGGSIAHLASGGDGWQTTFVLVNTGTSAAQATLSFFADQTGSPLSLPLSFPQFGSGTTTMAPSVTRTLAAGATLLIVSSGSVNLLTGSAQLSTAGNVGGFVIFRHNDQEAVVPLESRNANAYILAFDNTGGTFTAVAVNSVSTQAVNVPVIVRDDTGAQIATDTLNLSANGHAAFTLVTDKYPATANIRGTIEFDKPHSGQIGVLGIRIPPTSTYTTLPALAK